MSEKLMVLPSSDFNKIRVINIPDDYDEHEAFRRVTGLIAQAEEANPDYSWDDIANELEESGFQTVNFNLGPVID